MALIVNRGVGLANSAEIAVYLGVPEVSENCTVLLKALAVGFSNMPVKVSKET